MRREGQAHSPTKSGCDSADVKAYRRIQMLALQKARVVVRGEGGCGFERVVGMERLVGVKQSLR